MINKKLCKNCLAHSLNACCIIKVKQPSETEIALSIDILDKRLLTEVIFWILGFVCLFVSFCLDSFASLDFVFILFFYFLKILFIHERHRERERKRQRHRQREKQAPCKEPDVGLNPRSPGSHPGLQAVLNCCATGAAHRFLF